MEAQGHIMEEALVLQDNNSTILLAKNGVRSSGKKIRHVNIRYFFIADRIKRGKLTIAYCPTEDMVSDYLSKPTKGSIIRKHRKSILGKQNM